MAHQFHHHHHHAESDDHENLLTSDGTTSQHWFDRERPHNGVPDTDEESIRFSVNYAESETANMSLHQESQRQRKEKEMLQQRLSFYFMSPIDKWRIKRRLPLKLMFQLAKILFVTMQILYFGNEMSDYLKYEDNTRTAFRETLLAGWDPTREIFAYPPSTGAYAVYTIDSFYSNINYAIQKYSNMSHQSVGNFAYDFDRSRSPNNSSEAFPRILLEKLYYKKRIIDPEKYILNFDDEVLFDLLTIENLYAAGDERWINEFDISNYIREHFFNMDFNSLIVLKMKFPLRTVYFNSDGYYGKNTIRCYELNITFEYDNSQHDGLIQIKLSTERKVHQCKNHSNTTLTSEEDGFQSATDPGNLLIFRQHHFVWPHILNWFVLTFCLFSSLLCIRSIYRGQLLRAECSQFFKKHYHQPLKWEEIMEFVDLSIITILLNDILIISGTLLKMQLETSEIIDSEIYTRCSLLLGIGNLLVWIGLLRYFSYFQSYNILIITVRKAIPNCLRFLVCVFMLYGGFCFCGWIVLGPHHLKFRTLSSTAECLFSLMNGDDMFATFFSADVKHSSFIWWFSRFYLYVFISFSIYVIVSLFIAIILDSYESIRDFYGKRDEEIRTRLQKFADEVPSESIDGRSFTNNSIVDHIYRFVFFRA